MPAMQAMTSARIGNQRGYHRCRRNRQKQVQDQQGDGHRPSPVAIVAQPVHGVPCKGGLQAFGPEQERNQENECQPDKKTEQTRKQK